ncbi:MAG: N-acetylmuramoyl-L-alanine amidase [Eggerthellaceae bacterium]|nr:N-acetylmuramoyl-L-alanine amidase [Eggerthellaceae bacterium]
MGALRIHRPFAFALAACMSILLVGCGEASGSADEAETGFSEPVNDSAFEEPKSEEELPIIQQIDPMSKAEEQKLQPSAEELYAELGIQEDIRSSFVHGEKPVEYQKYIVLHDTEGDSDASSVIDWWDSNGNLVAAHFIVNKDGSVYQCAPMDKIVHHAGYGDIGHNEAYGVEDESRDDMKGTTPIGSWASDYGMNSHSIGIEMVHVGGSGSYPEAQLEAVDKLIAYIDAYYGFESQIIDHKDWRSGNSDTSDEFEGYLDNYKAYRVHSLPEEGPTSQLRPVACNLRERAV